MKTQGTKSVKDDGSGEKEEPAHQKVNWEPEMKKTCGTVLLLYDHDETLEPTANALYEYIKNRHGKYLDKYETPARRLAYKRIAVNALIEMKRERSRNDK